MLAPDQPLRVPTQLTRDGDVVQGVLDALPVTDTVYHHLAYTRPLVDSLVREVRRNGPAGRVLVIGPNELLPRVLAELGYEVDVWVLDGLPLSEDVRRQASRSGPIDEVLGTSAGHPADVVVIPYVIEAASQEPSQLMSELRTCVKPNGHVVIACRQPGELRRRLRGTMRKLRPTIGADYVFPPSPTWPALPAKRFLTSHDLARAGDRHFTVVRSELVVDHRAYFATEALSLGTWLRKLLLHLAKVVVPAFRDCALVTLAASGPPVTAG